MYRIYIPSYKRSEEAFSDKKTLHYISEECKKNTFLVVREEEFDLYAPKSLGVCGIVTIPTAFIEKEEKRTGRQFLWADTMDFILEYAIIEGVDHAVICDDDLSFFCIPKDSPNLTKMNHEDWNRLMLYLQTADEVTPLKATGFRGFTNSKKGFIDKNSPVNGFFCFHIPTIKKGGFRFCTTEALHMADRHMVLSLLTHGYHTETSRLFVFNTFMDTKGGCSLNRTQKDHSKSALALAREYPAVVELKIKTNLGDSRVATTVFWKKAFKERIV